MTYQDTPPETTKERLTPCEWTILECLRRDRDAAQRALDAVAGVLAGQYRLGSRDKITQSGEIVRGVPDEPSGTDETAAPVVAA